MAEAPAPFLQLGAVNIYVRDQERSLRFYLDQLGFVLAYDARLGSGRRWVAVAPPDGTAVLALIVPSPESRAAELIGRYTGVVFVTEDVTAKYAEWRRRGVQFAFVPRLRRVDYHVREDARSQPGPDQAPPWGGVFTQFSDPDGNRFGLVGFDEVTREIEAKRMAAAEKLEAERRAAQELEIAKSVQSRLFPQTLPTLGSLEFAGLCVQARQVGGDYYDFLDLGDERLGLVIGDTSGKGMPAALLMANLQANLRSQCATAADRPRHFLQSVNRQFYENTIESAYATLFFAEYDGRSGRLRYANCGHLPALVFRRDGALERLESTATVLGLFGVWDCAIRESALSPGDAILLYTDGVTEAFNAEGEEFGERRLIECLAGRRDVTPQAMIGAVVDELRRFSPHEQHDDITLVAARRPEE